MKTQLATLLSVISILALVPADAATRYVNLANPSPLHPYTTWSTAATVIQVAIDAADAGDEVVVTNGVYTLGGRALTGGLMNRVAITKALTVRSVNGPEVTVISGGGSARCVYLANDATLIGLTLTNGITLNLFNDQPAANGGGVWCESASAVVSHCVLTGNSANFTGGGASGGTLSDCVLSNNKTHYQGGGAGRSTLNNCVLTGNSSIDAGGGASHCLLSKSILISNSSNVGGGAVGCTLIRCILNSNSALIGGGAYECTLTGCELTKNSAGGGGGVSDSILNNCTLTGNSADSGGGAFRSELNNCIVFYNHGLGSVNDNYSSATFNYSCTTPLPAGGLGNISSEPKLASASHLSFGSPCRMAGSAAYTSGVDIDGESWSSQPSMGCDELHSEGMTGPLTVAIAASYTNVATSVEVIFIAQIGGQVSASWWDFGDGTVVSNRPYAAHHWTRPGDYPVVLWAYNESFPGGVSTSITLHVVNPSVHYVNGSGVSPKAPFSSWETAATNIQDAVDSASVPGALVLVTNGVYQIAAFVENVVTITNALTLRSMNGPEATVIEGGGRRCVSLSEGAMLIGFTLTNGGGMFGGNGGGVLCADLTAVVSNCVIIGNTSYQGGGGGAAGGTLNNCVLINNYAEVFGGGAYGCTLNDCTLNGNGAGCVFDCSGGGGGAALSILNNCTLTSNRTAEDRGPGGGGAYGCTLSNCALNGNSAGTYGGGVSDSTVNNCTLTSNSAGACGGGAYGSRLNNCIVYYNFASQEGDNYDSTSELNNSCTTPVPPSGRGNFAERPRLVDLVGGNFRLQPNSPCINAGRMAFAPVGQDLDGNQRISAGAVDIGAYEFQGPTSTVSYAWLQQFGLPTDGSADFADPDGDHFNNDQEWRAGTDPMNPLSGLRLLIPSFNGIHWLVRWQSVPERTYTVERSVNLSVSNGFLPVAATLPGQLGTMTVIDTNSTAQGPTLYRVRVEE